LLELVPIPVSDVDRAKAFYTEQVGSISISTSGPVMSSASCN
jgi:predicted enzyme related to lactoylglutathione lyase